MLLVIIEYLLKVIFCLFSKYSYFYFIDDKLYIVMELIAGSSLQDYLSLLKETNRKMTEENIWRVFIQLILALRYLHKEKGIVHRDLTANNIMLDDEYRVKISKSSHFEIR
jgi:serine/threonine protein kinase